MAKTLWFPVFIGLVAMGAAPVAAMAATQFQPEAQVIWLKRTEAMAAVAGDETTAVEGKVILANMRSSCDGLQAEQMSHEYGKTPRWALLSQVYACSAFYRWSGGGWLATKVPCIDAQRGIDALKEMKPEDEAAEVVKAATNLKGTLEAQLAAAKSGSLRCRY
jgi:hypothetical protein